MFQWQHLFSARVLQKGREYYREGKVGALEKSNDVYYASVDGTFSYNVQVKINDNRVEKMACSCPYSEGGYNCKHMAAVLYKIQNDMMGNMFDKTENTESEPERDLAVQAQNDMGYQRARQFFAPCDDGIYRYFRIEKLVNSLQIDQATLKKAVKLYRSGEMDRAKVEYMYIQGYDGLVGEARLGPAGYNNTYIRFTKDGIISKGCSSIRCYQYTYLRSGRSTVCEHQLALLLWLDDYLEKNPHGDSTDYTAALMLSKFLRGSLGKEVRTESENSMGREIQLEPRVAYNGDYLGLSFKIGTSDSKYVLKDMSQLINAVENNLELELGAKLKLDFSHDCFSEGSKQYYAIIQRYVKDEETRAELIYQDSSNYVKPSFKQIRLGGSLLDSFYETAFPGPVLYDCFEDKNLRLLLEENIPEISLKIEKCEEQGEFDGIDVAGYNPHIFDGVKYHYFLDGKTLNRFTDGEYLEKRTVLESLPEGDFSFHIGRERMKDFYHNLLPVLGDDVRIIDDDRESIAEYLPPEAEIVFYLDAEDGIPLCKPEARYGDKSYGLSDRYTPGAHFDNVRNALREVQALDTLDKYFNLTDKRENIFISGTSEDEIYRVITEGVDSLCREGEVLSTARFDALKVRKKVQVKLGVSVESDLMNLTISSEDVSLDELYGILQSYKLKKKYHRLKNGEFINLDDSVAELSAMVDALRLSPRDFIKGNLDVPAYRALYLDKMLEESEEIYASRDRHFKNLIKDFKTVNDSDFEIPDVLEKTLRPYQITGHKWIRTLAAYGFGGILADDMGLGKTLQIISVLLAEKELVSTGTSLVVCPASLVFNWVEEFKKFAPEMSVCPIVGTQAEREKLIDKYTKWDVLITSYDLLKRDAPHYEGKYFFYEIIDEAQFIKTHTTAAAKAVKVIKSKYRFALTGTPIENRLSELWSIFDFLMPGFLYGYDTFRNELEIPITKKQDEYAISQLKKMVSPFILRRLKTDVLKDLPEKTEENRMVKFGGDQQKLYDAQVVHMKDMISGQDEDNFKKNKIQILAELTKIRQICCDPGLVFENYEGESAKREACIDLIKSAVEGDHRVLLFSQFTSMLELLKTDLENEGLEFYELTGATPKQKRVELVNSFNTGNVPVFLISLKAGGTGLNLTGADIVIHYDPWWNAAAQNQATDRAHRIGQTRPVTVYKLVAMDSIEEKILKLQEAKQNLADEIISGETTSIGGMSREELLELIG